MCQTVNARVIPVTGNQVTEATFRIFCETPAEQLLQHLPEKNKMPGLCVCLCMCAYMHMPESECLQRLHYTDHSWITCAHTDNTRIHIFETGPS